jgi:acyl-CoA dehydrogenase
VFDNVELDESKVLGKVGQGFELTKDWFVEARLQIAANCLGAAIRAAEVANAYRRRAHPVRPADPRLPGDRIHDRRHGGRDHGGQEHDLPRGLGDRPRPRPQAGPRPRVRRQAAIRSEMAGRVIDRALQILGGRGYMRENPVERLYRDIRVDRIWEGTSEIQRAIIGGQIKKRGLGAYTDWV